MIPTIHVVTPAYNAASSIAEAVNSCRQDRVAGIVVVDDASTDDTVAVCRSLPCTVLRLAQNSGQYVACNSAFAYLRQRLGAEATPDTVIAMLDADDVSAPQRFATTAAAFDNDPELMILGGQMEEMDAEGHFLGSSYTNIPDDPALVLSHSNQHVLINGVMAFRFSALDILGGYEPASGGADTEFIIRAFYAGLKMRNVRTVLGYRRMLGNRCTANSQSDPERAAYRSRLGGSWLWWRHLARRGRLRPEYLRIHPVTTALTVVP